MKYQAEINEALEEMNEQNIEDSRQQVAQDIDCHMWALHPYEDTTADDRNKARQACIDYTAIYNPELVARMMVLSTSALYKMMWEYTAMLEGK